MYRQTEPELAAYIPGAIGRIAELHARHYSEEWDFGLYFEAKVASELAAFLQRFDAARDGFWTLTQDGRVEGSIALDASDVAGKGAHLRWFILSEDLRGQGWGRRLLGLALDLCRQRGYDRAYLWTFRGLDAARHLYEAAGFRLVEELEAEQWGKRVLEQRYELRFK